MDAHSFENVIKVFRIRANCCVICAWYYAHLGKNLFTLAWSGHGGQVSFVHLCTLGHSAASSIICWPI